MAAEAAKGALLELGRRKDAASSAGATVPPPGDGLVKTEGGSMDTDSDTATGSAAAAAAGSSTETAVADRLALDSLVSSADVKAAANVAMDAAAAKAQVGRQRGRWRIRC